MSREHDDQALVQRVRTGDTNAFAELWQIHATEATRFAMGVTRAFDADDLVSEAYVRILSALQRGKGPTGPFRPYLFVVIRNIAVSWARGNRETDLEDAETVPDPRGTDTAILAVTDETLTMRAFRSLPERWQQALWLSEVEGMQAQEIGDRLSMRANSAAALTYRAREGLRQAWIQAHIDVAAAGSEHRWVLERVGKWSRGALSARDGGRMDAHLLGCGDCRFIAREAKAVSSSFTTMLLPLAAGITGTAGLGWAALTSQVGSSEPAATVAAEQRTTHPAPLSRPVAFLRTRRGKTVTAAAAAAALIAALSWSAVASRPTPVVAEDAPTPSPSTSSQQASSEPTSTSTTAPQPAASGPGGDASTPAASTHRTPTAHAGNSSATTQPETNATATEGQTADSSTRPAPAASVPVTIAGADTSNGAYFPVLNGTAKPGSTVSLTGRGTSLGTAITGNDGRWSTTQLPVPAGTSTITATASGSSAWISVTVRQPIVSTSFVGSVLTVRISGVANTSYTATWDGIAIGSATADASGSATINSTVNTTASDHTVVVHASAGSRSGPTTTVTVRL